MHYILKYSKDVEFDLDFTQLAEHMWFKTYLGESLVFSHYGTDQILNVDHRAWYAWNKSFNDSRWEKFDVQWSMENIEFIPFKKAKTDLYVQTTHKNILSVDRRALARFVYALTSPYNAQISADNGETWQNPEAFKAENVQIMTMSFEDANRISLNEAGSGLVLEDEPDRDDVFY